MKGYIEQKIIELQNSKTATEITQNAKYFINILAENERLTKQLEKPCKVGAKKEINVTNADRIRSMSDKELAEFLRNIRDCGDYEELKFIGGVCMDYVSVIEWLKQPAKEELI